MNRELTHQTAQAKHQLLSLSTLNTPHLACRQQCQRRPFSIAPNFQAKWSSPQKASNINISNYTILDTFRRIWLFAARSNALNLLSVVNLTLAKLQLMTWKPFHTLNMLKTSLTRSLSHRDLLCRGRKHPLALVLRWVIPLLSFGNAALRVSWRRIYRTIPTTCLRHVKSTNISSVGSRRRVWRRTRTTCGRKKTPLGVSQTSKIGIASRSSWLACQMFRLSGSGNYTLSRIWDGMTITKGLSNTGVETLSNTWDGWCCSQPMPNISCTPLSVAITAIRHRNASTEMHTADSWWEKLVSRDTRG